VKERRNPTNDNEPDIMPVQDPPSPQQRVQARDDRARSRELNSATWSGRTIFSTISLAVVCVSGAASLIRTSNPAAARSLLNVSTDGERRPDS